MWIKISICLTFSVRSTVLNRLDILNLILFFSFSQGYGYCCSGNYVLTVTNDQRCNFQYVIITQFLFVQDRFGWIYGERLFFSRRNGIIERYVKTIKKARDVTVFDASLQNDRQGIKQLFGHC